MPFLANLNVGHKMLKAQRLRSRGNFYQLRNSKRSENGNWHLAPSRTHPGGGRAVPTPRPLYIRSAQRPYTQNLLKKDIFYLGWELMPHIQIR